MLRYVALVSLLLAPEVVDAKCAMVESGARTMTTADTVIEDGGGVLVTAVGYSSDDAANQAGWRFVADGKTTKPVITSLAPGLDLYVLPDSPAATIVLETAKHERIVDVRRSTTRDASRLPAPVVASIESLADVRTRFNSASTTVHLPTPPPRGAIALIVYGLEGGQRTAYTYGGVGDGDRDVLVYRSAHCTFPPAGSRQPAAGERIVVAWIDRSGRVSEPSKPIVVVAGKSPR